MCSLHLVQVASSSLRWLPRTSCEPPRSPHRNCWFFSEKAGRRCWCSEFMLPIPQVFKDVGWSTHMYTQWMLAFLLCSCFWNKIDYLCILCYLQPDPYFSFFQQDVCADGSELLLQERGTFEPYFGRRDCCFIACSPLRHVHTRNIKRMPLKISFFGRKRLH